MPQYVVLIYANDSAHAPGATRDNDADVEECDDHADELTDSGSMVAAYAMTPRDLAVTVRADGVTPGPFLGEQPIVAGFYILEAPDIDAAVAMAGLNPVVAAGGGVEVRPLHSGGVVPKPEPAAS